MPWLFEIEIQHSTDSHKVVTERQYAEAERVDDVLRSYQADAAHDYREIVLIKRLVPISRHIERSSDS